MKTLYLVRHAKSSWDNPGLSDFERSLNKRGERDAPFMGQRLKKINVAPDIIISSPAKRAKKTAKIIAGEIGYSKEQIVFEESIYEADVPELLKVILNIEDSNTVAMLFGHNPGFTYTANYLCGNHTSNIPTCGIICMDFDINSWKEVKEKKGFFKFFDFPKKHK